MTSSHVIDRPLYEHESWSRLPHVLRRAVELRIEQEFETRFFETTNINPVDLDELSMQTYYELMFKYMDCIADQLIVKYHIPTFERVSEVTLEMAFEFTDRPQEVITDISASVRRAINAAEKWCINTQAASEQSLIGIDVSAHIPVFHPEGWSTRTGLDDGQFGERFVGEFARDLLPYSIYSADQDTSAVWQETEADIPTLWEDTDRD